MNLIDQELEELQAKLNNSLSEQALLLIKSLAINYAFDCLIDTEVREENNKLLQEQE